MFSKTVRFMAICLFVLTCTWQNKANSAVPAGIYLLIPPQTPIPEAVLKSPMVSGVILRANWQDIHTDSKEPDFAYLIAQANIAKKAGKAVSLVINNGGINTPDAILENTQHISFLDKNRFHDSYNQQLAIPLFWDDTLIEEKKALLSDIAVLFDEKKLVDLISLQCANATTDDWNVPATIDWGRHTFTEDKLFFACKMLIDHAASVFRHASMKMALGPLPPSLMKDRYALAQRVYRYASQTYPDRFYMQRHNLSTRTPDPLSTQQLYGWRMVFEARPYAAAQFLWPAKDTVSCRANGNRTPCDSEDILGKIATLASHYGFRYLEVYLSDFLAFGHTSAFSSLYDAMSSSTPAPPLRENVLPASDSFEKPLPSKSDNHDVWGSWSNTLKQRKHIPVTHFQFSSSLLQKQVGYSLYLPATPDQSILPVIYWLHGKGGNEVRGVHLVQFLQSAINQNIIRPTAMVFINAGLQSFYTDSKDGTVPVESMLMNELIPYIEQQHDIGQSSTRRLLEGFSMGGFGALKLAAKYPDRFAAVNIYGGALLSDAFLPGQRDVDSFHHVFGSDKDYFIRNTPSYWLEKNVDTIQSSAMPIRIRVGTQDGTRRYNQAMKALLEELSLKFDYAEIEGVRHAPAMYYQSDKLANYRFFEQVLNQSESEAPQSAVTLEIFRGAVNVTTAR